MGWFSRAVSSVGRSIASAASKAWETAKSVASKAINWMADEAEGFVGKVKDIWKAVKPYVEKIAPWLDKAANLIPFPWAQSILKVTAKGLQALLALENSPLLKKIEAAINWAIEKARYLQKTFLTPQEEQEAVQRQKDFQDAMDAMRTEEERQSMRFAALINDYILVQTRIKQILDNDEVKDFEHFLRLRATQKLLKSAEKTLTTAKSISDITADDAFLIRAGADLLAENPTLSETDAERLDSIIKRRYNGKSLLPFVFEEMIRAWQNKLEDMRDKWNRLNGEKVEQENRIDELEIQRDIRGLNSEEEHDLLKLKNDIKTSSNQLKEQAAKNWEMQNYVFAAEGFLQMLEKTSEQFEAEGRGFIADDVAEVGMLLIACAQNGKKWGDLTQDQQSLITDYANIFAKDSKKRSQDLIEAEVA